MKNQSFIMLFLLSCVTLISGCSAVEGIFKAGMSVGIFIVIFIIGLIIFLIMRMGGKKG
ncbi:hypothetical protein BH11BAC2_BH11BAC2_25640 [soil metagenome]